MIYYIKSYKGSNAYYAKSTLIATSMWKSTDAWRGYSEIVPEPDFKKIDEGAVTGDWEDAPSGTSSREVLNEFKKLEKKYGTIYVILTETSNLFMQGYDVLIRTNATKPCRYKLDGKDADGTKWYRCKTHNELAPSKDWPCAGWQNPYYKEKKKIDANTYKYTYPDGSWKIRYHATYILIYNAINNKYLIDNGGYLTRTTKERINRYLPKGQVFQKNFEWYYQNGNDVRKIEQVLTI
jgi:hypothetical protein